MTMLQNANAISAGGYDINNSLRFRSSASAYLSRTFVTGGTSRQIQTCSLWVKRGTLGSTYSYMIGAYDGSSGFDAGIQFLSDNLCVQVGGVSSTLTTTQVFRDPSAWYHIVVAIDTTQATAANRVKVYVNGNQVTAFSTATYPAQNSNINFLFANGNNRIGCNWNNNGTTFFDGYMTDINFIDGQALTPSSFGETDTTTGSWKPKAYTGTYGTNGFYLKFSDIATTSGSNAGLGKDFSGNTNYWNTNNISVTSGVTYDAMKDSPTNTSATVANYAVLNPIYSTAYAGNVLAANLQINSPTTDGFCPSTIAVSSGKWYYETSMTNSTGASFLYGIVKTTAAQAELRNVGTGNGYSYLASTGVKSDGSGGASTAYGATFTTGDVMGCAFDLDAGTITFYKNNVSQGVAYTGISGEFMAAVGDAASGTGGQTAWINFGQRPFSYTPPAGYLALNTYNLPTSTILQGNKYMDATTYTGTGSTLSVVNAAGFKPDLVWTKNRSFGQGHILEDSVRGALQYLGSESTAAESTIAGSTTSFNSNGFSVGSYAGSNQTGYNYVGWQWQAGQGSTSSNTQGSITSTVSVNATAGFSVVTYTGTGANATVGHGLGVAPKFIIFKSRSNVNNWPIWATAMNDNLGYIFLNLTNAKQQASVYWNSTAPTSSVFSLGTTTDVNGSGTTFVAYCWAEIAGFSKFTSYTGNNSTDGPFVYLGFRPKFVMIKASSAVGVWAIWDTSRNTFNISNSLLQAQSSGAEGTNVLGDILSNGFKIRDTNTSWNSTQTYIVAAWAENPFKNSNAR